MILKMSIQDMEDYNRYLLAFESASDEYKEKRKALRDELIKHMEGMQEDDLVFKRTPKITNAAY